jgi:hypothetical protein
MALPLMLLGLTTISGVGAGMYLNKRATEDAELTANVGGWPLTPALGIGGLALALLGGSWLAPIGLGMAVASLVSGDALGRVREGLDRAAAGKIADQIAPPGPPALPGPASVGPPPQSGPAPGAGLLSWLVPPPRS